MIALHWRATNSGVMLPEVLAAATPVWQEPPIGLVSGTGWHGFVRLGDGQLAGWHRSVPPDQVFYARLFGEQVELRWLHERAGAGRAVLLAETSEALRPANESFGAGVDEKCCDIQDGSFLLWGTPDHAEKSWYVLREHRIGRLPVPCPPPSEKDLHLALRVREYVGRDAHGNAYVVDERLLGLEWQPTRPAPENEAREQEGAR